MSRDEDNRRSAAREILDKVEPEGLHQYLFYEGPDYDALELALPDFDLEALRAAVQTIHDFEIALEELQEDLEREDD